MKKLIKIFIIFLVFCSCSTVKSGFKNPVLFVDTNLSLQEALNIEKGNKAKDVSPDYFVGLGESIYPNINNYKLEIPKSFSRIEKPNFICQVDYYYTKVDSSVKVILYEWSNLSNDDFFEQRENLTKEERIYSKFREKFEVLIRSIENELGPPTSINLESKSQLTDFRDDVHWQNTKNKNVYLFMFGNNNQTYRQIRMVIYKK